MAAPALIRSGLPSETELNAFARAAAHLLTEQLSRSTGSRTVRRRAGVGIQHLDHRDYTPGDEVRHIDWRQTARRRRPIVRRFESESVSDWSIVVDVSASMVVPTTAKWRAGLQAAAAMAYALLELGHRVALVAFGLHVRAQCPYGRGLRHYAAIARALSALPPPAEGERSALGACVPYVRGAASVFVISDFLADDEMRADLAALLERSTALHALQVSDPAETDVHAAIGDTDLIDVETKRRVHVALDDATRALASAERQAMTDRLRAFCLRSGIAFSDWHVGRPWQNALIRHLVDARSMC